MSETSEKHVCPVCGEVVEQYFEIYATRAFTASPFDVMHGIEVWGIYDVPKFVICEHEEWVHFMYGGPDDIRLVKMLGELDIEEITRKKDEIAENPQPCQEPGCMTDEDGIPCYMSFADLDPSWYCWEHARENGHCPSCGYFYAGVDSFDFSLSGLCRNCADELNSEMDDYYDEDADFGWDYYPQSWHDPDSDLDDLEDEEPYIYIGPPYDDEDDEEYEDDEDDG